MGATGAIRLKIDLEFTKEAWARFYSHHDLMRFFARALRRSELPVRYTAGFNPHPRVVFLTPLGLGIASRCEHVEMEFAEDVGLETVRNRLSALMLPGMSVCGVARLPAQRRGRQVGRVVYCLQGLEIAAETLDAALAAVAARRPWVLERLGKRGTRRVDVSESLEHLERDGRDVVCTIATRPAGTLRTDELVAALAALCGVEQAAVTVLKIRCELN